MSERPTITVTAKDMFYAEATQTFTVTVETGNSDPMAVGTIPAVMVTVDETSDVITLGDYFSDADMDDLTYTQMSSNSDVATAEISEDDSNPGVTVYMLTVTGHMAGEATITVTASDGMGGTPATQTIAVTVTQGALIAPTLTATPGSGSVTLSWDRAGGVEYTVAGVRADASPVRQGAESTIIWVPNITETSYTVSGLTGGAEYWFTVASCGDAECSVWRWADVQMVWPTN